MLETTSESTHAQDVQKRKVYERLGVVEYFQFDPLGEYLEPPLQGFRLVQGRYEPVRPNPDASLLSHTLGVLFGVDGSRLRLSDAATGLPLLRREEIVAARRQAEDRAHQAEAKNRALEEELARLRRVLGEG